MERFFLFMAIIAMNASLGTAQPFEPREPFGEPYGPQWNLVLNEGQTFDLGDNYRSDVVIQSVGTTPSPYLFDDSRTGFTFSDPVTAAVSRIDLTFIGEGATAVSPELYHQTGMMYNFYEENTPDGVTGVEAGKHAIFEDVYPFIDFHVLSNPWGPKFYIVLRPGAEPSDLLMQVSGHDSLQIDLTGELEIWFENHYLRLREGFAYQQEGDSIVDVEWVAHYQNNNGSANVNFDLGVYDPELPLILCIKPWLPPMPPPPPALDPEWSTYFPGIANDAINDLTHDDGGNVYFTGASNSTNGLPIAAGVQQEVLDDEFDMIVGKVNPNYEIEAEDTWMTYFGSAVRDHGTAIVYSPTSGGRLAVCGLSESNSSQPLEYPMGDSYSTDAGFGLLALFDPSTGLRTYCTHLWSAMPGYYNSSGPADLDYDVSGNLFLVGSGHLHAGVFNSEVVDPAGNNDYTSLSHINNGGLYLQDSYIARFDPDMHLTWLTALGGPNDDRAFACVVDHVNSKLIVVGRTNTPNDLDYPDNPTSGPHDFPLTYSFASYHQNLLNGPSNCSSLTCGSDGFISVFSLSNLKLIYSTYLGPGIEDDALTDVVTDSEGNIYVAGWSTYHSYGETPCAWDMDLLLAPCDAGGHFDQETGPGTNNHFIVRLNADHAMTWSTWIAGGRDEYWAQVDEIGRPRLAVDQYDNVFLFGSTTSGSVLESDPIAPFVADPLYYSNFAHADSDDDPPETIYDTYLLKFDPETHLDLSTLLGGEGQDYACGITVVGGRVYVCGTTGSALFPTNAPVISGAEPYLVSDPSGPIGDMDAFMAQLGYDYTVGQEEHPRSHQGEILLYPNPTAGGLTITGLEQSERPTVVVLDVLGRLVMAPVIVASTTITLETSHLPQGSYLVRMSSLSGAGSWVFLKQ